ncbi:putative alpha-1,6-mannosyltransferase MNN10 [Yarrowia sp. C11]|nr:putative alpha-1,6-mannosyltransferase MNN10 [Yarrowia sp. C11]KAG5370656.1 putative alpha-1,6-mannosyltransferase MNN10 [Yarrowia sp. E02]
MSQNWRRKSSVSAWDKPEGGWSRRQRGGIIATVGGFVETVATALIRRKIFVVIFLLLTLLSFFTAVPFVPHFNWGSGKYVIILAANEGGGVMHWKGAKEWAIERSSIENKREYAERHGYHLAVKDVSLKKRYSHEWRESWQKVDIIKETMRQFPNAEWFWWLDLHTLIMEPQISLDQHIFNNLYNETYRDLTGQFNPLNLPVQIPYVDYNQPVDLIVTQDCGGFNLGSFFIRRSDWTDKLLDLWWDPVFYEQKHMEWEHKEQDALEYLFTHQPWIRGRVGFLPLRKINGLPPGACSEMEDDKQLFYDEKSRDFLVNMAGCEWGRDCWKEMESYKAKAVELHRKKWWLF